MTLAQLKTEALQSCAFRGHVMGTWIYYDHMSAAINTCVHCGKQVCVNAYPLPNEIDISGEAVALNCEY